MTEHSSTISEIRAWVEASQGFADGTPEDYQRKDRANDMVTVHGSEWLLALLDVAEAAQRWAQFFPPERGTAHRFSKAVADLQAVVGKLPQ